MSDRTATDLKTQEDNPQGWSYHPELNPSQQDYDKQFNAITSTHDNQALNDQGDAIARDHATGRDADSSRQAVQDGEKKAIGDTAAGKIAEQAAGTVGGVAGKLLVSAVGRLRTRSGMATGAVIAFIILLLVGLGIITPSAILLRLKEEGTSWMTKHTNIGVNTRMRQVLSARYFGDPSLCGSSKALCQFSSGITDDEISRLRETSGKISIDDGDIVTKDGKKYINKMTFTDNGTSVAITKENFADFHAKNVAFQAEMNSVIDAKGLTFRSKGALKKFASFLVDRSKPLGDTMTPDGIKKYFREKFYSLKNKWSIFSNGTPADDPENPQSNSAKEALNKLNLADEAASVLGDDVVTNGPRAVIPDVDGLTPAKAGAVAVETGLGGVKGAVLGALSGLNTTCSTYNTLRIINFGVKALAAASLIRYAALYLTTADKQKAGEINAAEIAFLASVLLRPSSVPASKGKDFSQSQGASLIFDHTVSRPNDLARFTLGSLASQALDKVIGVFNLGSASPEVCSKVLSWWGQIGLFLGGVFTTVISGGAFAVSGTALGVAKGLAFGYIQQVASSKLVPLIAGTIVPDPLTDPEGGYGAGNAIAAGLGAFGGQLGRAKGMRPLTKTQLATLDRSPDAAMLASTEAYRRQRMGLFNLDNPSSLPNQLAYELGDLRTSTQSVSSAVASMSSLVAQAMAPTTPASALTDEYGGQYCGDATASQAMKTAIDGVDFARDANCNLIYGPDPETLDTSKYSIENTVRYMIDAKQIDPVTLAPLDAYKTYLTLCTNGDDPIIDKYAADLSENTTMTPCYEITEQSRYFSVYTGLSDVQSGIVAAAQNQLGVESSSAPPSQDGQTNSGFSWPLGVSLWQQHRADFLGEHYASGGFLGDGRESVDISFVGIKGTPVYAMLGGTVTKQPLGRGTFGKCRGTPNGPNNGGMIITSTYQNHTIQIAYAHGDNAQVTSGQTVAPNQHIMDVGNVGNSCGAHLHMNMTVDGANVCPQDVFLAMDSGSAFDVAALLRKATPTCGGRG